MSIGKWQGQKDSNSRHAVLETAALPAELYPYVVGLRGLEPGGIYDRLSRYEAEEGVVIAYGSMYGNTEEVAEVIAEELSKQGIRNIVMHNVSHTSHSFIIADVFKYKGLIVGCPTYNTQMYPEMEALLSKLASREIKGRYLGYFGSFTWASAAVKKIAEFNDKLKFEPVGNPVEMKHSMKAETNTQAKELAKAMADRLKADRK